MIDCCLFDLFVWEKSPFVQAYDGRCAWGRIILSVEV